MPPRFCIASTKREPALVRGQGWMPGKGEGGVSRRVMARQKRWRALRDGTLAGALLVGGASTRFGSPKALARYQGEMLAERAHRVLTQAFGRVIVVGKAADGLELPFPVLDDGSDVRAAIVGVAAALRLADADTVVVLPTDMPFVGAELLLALAEASEGAEAAVPHSGPLPGAYCRSALPLLERCIAAGDLALYRACLELEPRVLQWDEAWLANVNEPADLDQI